MNITGSRDGKVFFIDDDKVMIDGKMYYEKAPQNLPNPDAYSLLAEVRALRERISKLTDIIDWMSNGHGAKQMELEYDIEMAEVSEHFS